MKLSMFLCIDLYISYIQDSWIFWITQHFSRAICALCVCVCWYFTLWVRPASSACLRSHLGGGWAASGEPPCGSPAAPPVFSGGRRWTLRHLIVAVSSCEQTLVQLSLPWCLRLHPACWCRPSPPPTPRVFSLRANKDDKLVCYVQCCSSFTCYQVFHWFHC